VNIINFAALAANHHHGQHQHGPMIAGMGGGGGLVHLNQNLNHHPNSQKIKGTA